MDENTQIRIIFIEHLIYDMELAELELVKSGINFQSIRVERNDQFISALKEFNPDLVISDFSLPQFNGMDALNTAREFDVSLPFIILTGTRNEEIAAECIKNGATDYVMKEHIIKLSFAVKEALKHRDVKREQIRTEKALLESESRYRSMFENNYAVMLIVNPSNGSIVDVNPAAADYYGFTRDIFIQKTIADISVVDKELLDMRHDMLSGKNKSHIISKQILKNGTIRDVEVFCSPINYFDKKLVHCIIQDITERNKAIEALQKSLTEKKDLIKEIQHRTKNNMQVILSMFSLQTIFSEDIKLEEVLREMENRIRAMSLVHEKLYQSGNLSRLILKDYLKELTCNIFSGYGLSDDKIKITDNMVNTEVLIDTAIPCGLVVNELISNVAKHAFPGEKKGELIINLCVNAEDEFQLSISDNGSGKGLKIDLDNLKTMGLQIVKNIVEYQLKGNIELDNTSGIKWTIKFRDNFYEERI